MKVAKINIRNIPEEQAERIKQLEAENEALQSRLAKCVDALKEMVEAMKRYEMDVDEEPPFKHRKIMEEAKQTLREWERSREQEGR